MKEFNKIVIKIGTSSLTYENGKLNLRQMESLSTVISDLLNQGKEIILVSSGAIGAGIGRLNLDSKPSTLALKQATAAVGQAFLMQIYSDFFMKKAHTTAQILLSREEIINSITRTNILNTLNTLTSLHILPIINENDTVSTDEIIGKNFTDNDNLSAYVATLVEADLLLILSNIDGLLDTNNEVINSVDEINDKVYSLVNKDKSTLGTGGMSSKLNAIKHVNSAGIDAYIINSEDMSNIYKAINNEVIGTFFKGA